MADVFTKAQRSKIMAAVKGRGARSTEGAVCGLFRRRGITGWRRHLEGVPGRPDFVFKRERVAVFVDGCFWHGCPSCGRRRPAPASNVGYWRNKFARNRARDRAVRAELRRLGWRVVRIWEHELAAKRLEATRRRVCGLFATRPGNGARAVSQK